MKRVAVLLELHSDYHRHIQRGLHRYMLGKPWIYYTGTDQSSVVAPTLLAWRPDGIVGQIISPKLIEAVQNLDAPAVNLGWGEGQPPPNMVTPDDDAIGRLAADHLLNCGFEHFAFFGLPLAPFRLRRKLAFTAAIEAAGKTVHGYQDPADAPRTEIWLRYDHDVADWLRSLPKPVAIAASDDGPASKLALICRELGLRMPEDVALLGVDNDELRCESVSPPISSIALPAERIGFEAAAMLDRLMAGGPPPTGPTLLPPLRVVPRQSTDITFIDQPVVTEAMAYIREHAHEHIGVEQVIQHLDVPRRWFERLFRRVLGRTPLAEIRRVRIEQAKRLLTETDLPLTAVAHRCGFADARRLNLNFRKQLDITPSTYRRQFQLA